jgi:hypothetical protein
MADGIKPHCMGTAFPPRLPSLGQGYYRWECACGNVSQSIAPPNWKQRFPLMDLCPSCAALPTAADLDAVAEEQRVKENTSRKP